MLAGGISGAMVFLFHALMKRMLGVSDYASVVALLGLLNVLGLPAAAMTFTMSRFVAEHIHNNSVASWVTLYKRAMRKITKWALLGLFLWATSSIFLADFFDAPSILSIIILGAIGVIRLYGPIVGGVLQGSQSFGYLAATRLANPFFRLLLCVLVVSLGGAVAGVMGAIAVSFAASLAIGMIPFRKVISQTETIPDYDTSNVYRYLFPVLLCQGAFLLLMNADIMFFKRFLYGDYVDLKGAYAQAATLSRSVIFLAGPLGVALFPRAVKSKEKKLFIGSLLCAAAFSGALAMFITLFPALPFKIMYGTDNPVCFSIARRYVWAAMPLSLIGITIKYLWARQQLGKAMILVPIVLVYLLILYLFHRTPYQIVCCLAIASWLSLSLLIIAAFKPDRMPAEGKK